MKHTLNLKKPLAIIDLETTGINISKDRIIEICIVKALPDQSYTVRTERINPEIPIPAESTKIHGLTNEDLKDAPSFKQIGKQICQHLDGCDLAGFNSNKFDIPLLIEEFLRNDIDFEYKTRKFVDVQRIFHMMEPRTLGAAVKFYCHKELTNAHSAEADTIATLEVLCAQIEKYEGVEILDQNKQPIVPIKNDIEALHNLTSTNVVDFAQTMLRNAKGQIVFNFGKHKGKLVTDILAAEPSYYDWIQKGDFPLDTKKKLTEILLSTKSR